MINCHDLTNVSVIFCKLKLNIYHTREYFYYMCYYLRIIWFIQDKLWILTLTITIISFQYNCKWYTIVCQKLMRTFSISIVSWVENKLGFFSCDLNSDLKSGSGCRLNFTQWRIWKMREFIFLELTFLQMQFWFKCFYFFYTNVQNCCLEALKLTHLNTKNSKSSFHTESLTSFFSYLT